MLTLVFSLHAQTYASVRSLLVTIFAVVLLASGAAILSAEAQLFSGRGLGIFGGRGLGRLQGALQHCLQIEE